MRAGGRAGGFCLSGAGEGGGAAEDRQSGSGGILLHSHSYKKKNRVPAAAAAASPTPSRQPTKHRPPNLPRLWAITILYSGKTNRSEVAGADVQKQVVPHHDVQNACSRARMRDKSNLLKTQLTLERSPIKKMQGNCHLSTAFLTTPSRNWNPASFSSR
jgi:hypothetical protein